MVVDPSDMRVLLGVGGREDSLRALSKTVRRVRETGDELTVAVFDDPDVECDVATVEETVRAELTDADLAAEVVVLEGQARSRLIEYAAQQDVDRIALGGGTTSPLGKVRLGTVAEFVVLNANVSVTLERCRYDG